MYGLTTSLGALKEMRIRSEEIRQFQENILMSHAVGIGPEHTSAVVRAIMLTRLNGMARGGAGVQPKVFELLVDMLNRGVHPTIPSRGSIGMSDLAPLAHMALPLIGKGEVEYRGRRLPSKVAFQEAGAAEIQGHLFGVGRDRRPRGRAVEVKLPIERGEAQAPRQSRRQ